MAYTFTPLLPQVRTALTTALTALSDSSKVSEGYPAGGLKITYTWVGAEAEFENTSAVSGWAQREESGEVKVRVIGTANQPSFPVASDLAWDLEHLVEQAVATDPTLGGLVDLCEVVRATESEAAPEEAKRQAGIEVTIRYVGSVTRQTV